MSDKQIDEALEALDLISTPLLKQDTVDGYHARKIATIRQALERQRVPAGFSETIKAIVTKAKGGHSRRGEHNGWWLVNISDQQKAVLEQWLATYRGADRS